MTPLHPELKLTELNCTESIPWGDPDAYVLHKLRIWCSGNDPPLERHAEACSRLLALRKSGQTGRTPKQYIFISARCLSVYHGLPHPDRLINIPQTLSRILISLSLCWAENSVPLMNHRSPMLSPLIHGLPFQGRPWTLQGGSFPAQFSYVYQLTIQLSYHQLNRFHEIPICFSIFLNVKLTDLNSSASSSLFMGAGGLFGHFIFKDGQASGAGSENRIEHWTDMNGGCLISCFFNGVSYIYIYKEGERQRELSCLLYSFQNMTVISWI